ncbi:MAG TPA: zinc finger domain-containing protein, partial [Kiritimatiellia bacterium]|nr:zinc finger domain-containing protein [Kiritimatiellia bacterium]
LKPLLLDQTFIAGLGNIYVDEALWEAKIHPQRKSDSLTTSESDALLKAVRKVLKKGIRNLGTSLGHGKANFQLPDGESGRNREALNVFRQTGLPCPRCGTNIERIKVGQRSTHICPSCQRKH